MHCCVVQSEAKAQPGVIAAAAKRSRPADDGGIVTAAQVALMGGQWRPSAEDGCAADATMCAVPWSHLACRPGWLAVLSTGLAMPGV